MGNPISYIDPLGLDSSGIAKWYVIPEVEAGGDNSMAYIKAQQAARAVAEQTARSAADRARWEWNFNNAMQEALSGKRQYKASAAELEEKRKAAQAAARYNAYVSNRSNYGKNPYSPSLGPQNANEWETFGDVLGATELPLVALLGDVISLGANIIKGSGSGILMSATAFIPFGSAFKLGAKTSSNVLLNTSIQLQSKFKHAGDFGVVGNYSKANAAKVSSALNQHINASGTQIIQGAYRNANNPVTFYLNPQMGLNVIASPSGQFISGAALSPVQVQGILTKGFLW